MFKDAWWVPLATGLQDGTNPCLLINTALILLGILWLKRTGIHKSWILFLIVSIVLSSFAFNCSFLDKIIFNKYFLVLVRWVYLPLAIVIGFKALQFLNQWYCLLKGKEIKAQSPIKMNVSPVVLAFSISLVGFLLSTLAALWPVNRNIAIFSVYMRLPGQFFYLGSLIFLYTVITLWLLFLTLWLLSLESKNQRIFKIMTAAILLSASLGAVGIVFMKG